MPKANAFSPVDLLASVMVNGMATKIAIKSPSYRVTLSKRVDVPYYKDLRFVLGSAGLLYVEFRGGESVRLIRDVSYGLLTSLFTSEVVRSRTINRLKDQYHHVVTGGNLIEEAIPQKSVKT